MYTARLRRGAIASEAALFKNWISASVLALAALVAGPGFGGGAPGSGDTMILLLSGVVGLALGDWLYFLGLTHIGVGRTLILTQATPVLTALAAWPLLGEELHPLQWLGVVTVVGGGVLAESQRVRDWRADRVGLLAAAGAAVAWSVANLMLHWGMAHTEPMTGGAIRLAGGTMGIVLLAALRGRTRAALRTAVSPRSFRVFLWPALVGTVLGMGFLAGAFKWSKQGVASAMASTVPLFSIPLAAVFLHERPGWRGWVGAALVVLGVVLVGFGR